MTLTLVFKLDLDVVLIYHCAKKKVSVPSASKVTAQTDTHTHTHTHTHTQQKHYLSAYAGDNNSHSFKPSGKLYGYVTPCFTLGG